MPSCAIITCRLRSGNVSLEKGGYFISSMKSAAVLLLAAVAVSNSAVINGPTPRFIMVTGVLGPDDSRLGSMKSDYHAPPGVTLISSEIHYSLPKVQLRLAKIQIIDYTSSGAVAVITSGGVGSDHVTIKMTPYNNRPFDFECTFWGNYTSNEPNSVPEFVTFRKFNTVPTSALKEPTNFLL